jgi:SnoaL-like protein
MRIEHAFARTMLRVTRTSSRGPLALVAAAIACATAIPCRAAVAQDVHKDAVRLVALRTMELETRRQLPGATPATIDSLLALYSDSVVYEHPTAGAVIRGKGALRQGMLRFIGTVRALEAEPPAVTVGQGVAVIETRARMEILDGGKWIPVVRHGIRVIELDAMGRVRRLIDYPW